MNHAMTKERERKHKVMYYIDVRYFVPLGINMLKSHAGWPWDWDPFNLVSEPTWLKFWLVTSLFFVFAFVSVEMHLHSLASCVRLRVRDFSATLILAAAASIFFPQALFWYAYPVMILLSSCYVWVSNLLVKFLCWLRASLSKVPVLNVVVTTTYDDEGAVLEPRPEPQGPAVRPLVENAGAVRGDEDRQVQV